jgi:hypothetical protein
MLIEINEKIWGAMVTIAAPGSASNLEARRHCSPVTTFYIENDFPPHAPDNLFEFRSLCGWEIVSLEQGLLLTAISGR